MTREEWKEWALSLKPGDTVVIERWGPTYMRATVQKITPTGRVNTDKGVFYQSSLGWYEGYGTNRGYLLKPTPELLEKAKLCEAEEMEQRRKKEAINKAVKFVSDLNTNRWNIGYDKAKKILKLQEELEGDNHG